jgi:hypothetical protein
MNKGVYGGKWSVAKSSLPDVNIPNTLRESIRNKIAECAAHGLNSTETARLYLPKVSKAVLVRIIRDYQEGTLS